MSITSITGLSFLVLPIIEKIPYTIRSTYKGNTPFSVLRSKQIITFS